MYMHYSRDVIFTYTDLCDPDLYCVVCSYPVDVHLINAAIN